jgi:hypothetical protein
MNVCYFSLLILYEVHHVKFSLGTKEGTTLGSMVRCTERSDITVAALYHMEEGDRGRLTKLISHIDNHVKTLNCTSRYVVCKRLDAKVYLEM